MVYLNELGQDEFVDVDTGCVSVIEDQRETQAIWTFVHNRLIWKYIDFVYRWHSSGVFLDGELQIDLLLLIISENLHLQSVIVVSL